MSYTADLEAAVVQMGNLCIEASNAFNVNCESIAAVEEGPNSEIGNTCEVTNANWSERTLSILAKLKEIEASFVGLQNINEAEYDRYTQLRNKAALLREKVEKFVNFVQNNHHAKNILENKVGSGFNAKEEDHVKVEDAVGGLGDA